MDCIVHGAAKSWTWLSDFHFHLLIYLTGWRPPWECPGPVTCCVAVVLSLWFWMVPHGEKCWGNPSVVWKRVCWHRAFQKGVSLLKAKSRDTEGTANAACQPPDRPGRVDTFGGFTANFYSFKTRKIPAGRLELDDWLGHHRVTSGVGIFA